MALELVERDEKAQAQAIAALTLAFVRDPVIRWLLPEPETYLSHFPAFARSFGGPAFAAGTAWMSDSLPSQHLHRIHIVEFLGRRLSIASV